MRIETRHFVNAHGKAPRGYGHWGFCAEQFYSKDDYLNHVMWHSGTYAEAKQRAVAFFRTKPGVDVVVVCS